MNTPILEPPPTLSKPWSPELAQELAPRYWLEGTIGEGASGVVYRARHTALGRPVAVKVLRAEILEDPDLVERFRREGQSASRIDSEHVVSILDFGQLRTGAAYIVMELLEGRSLSEELEIKLRFPLQRAVRVARQLCDALGAAHRIGVVHRDLKPENIFLTKRKGEHDFVKVVDFGIAKIAGAATITVAGHLLGTAAYMPPEQCVGEEVDARCDVYSFGVVLYEMLTGRVPFAQSSLHKLLAAHVSQAPTPPRTYRPDLPPALEAIVLRCLAKQRGDRYQSMEAVAEALDAVMLEEPKEAAPTPPPMPIRTAPRKFPFAMIPLVIVGLFVGLALGICIRFAAGMPPFEHSALDVLRDAPYAETGTPDRHHRAARRVCARHGIRASAGMPPFDQSEAADSNPRDLALRFDPLRVLQLGTERLVLAAPRARA